MGWSDPSMPARYQHLVTEVRTDVADRLGTLVWKPEEEPKNRAERAQMRRKLRRKIK
jgi:integrase